MSHDIVVATLIGADKRPPKDETPGILSLVFREGDCDLTYLNVVFGQEDGVDRLEQLEDGICAALDWRPGFAPDWLVRLAKNRETKAIDYMGNINKPRWFQPGPKDRPNAWRVYRRLDSKYGEFGVFSELGSPQSPEWRDCPEPHFLVAQDCGLTGWPFEHTRIGRIKVDLQTVSGGLQIRIEVKTIASNLVGVFNFFGERDQFLSDVIRWLLKLADVTNFTEINGKLVCVKRDHGARYMLKPIHGGHSRSYGGTLFHWL